MEKIEFDFGKLKNRKSVAPTEAHALAKEVYDYFRPNLKFGAILGLIKYRGTQCIRECLIETQKANFPHKTQLFMAMMKKYNTKFE